MSLLPLSVQTLRTIIDIMAFAMVLIALGIISVGAIQRMIQLYQVQSLVLALLTMLVALKPGEANLLTRVLLITFALLIPGMLLYIIESLLAQATTVPQEMRWTERLTHPFRRLFRRRGRYQKESQEAIRKALPVWLEHGLSPSRQATSVVIGLILTAVAYVVSFSLIQTEPERARSLAVSMTLLMLGIFTMINRRDLISQIMGLLVMDHGLFLATVGFISQLALISIFIISLFLYIQITLLILVILLPELHEESKTIEVAHQNTLKG